jgi:uncharacterized protein YdeI (YjbR/CyaY-like superfamily)
MGMISDPIVMFFASASAWEGWLFKHLHSHGVWVKVAQEASDKQALTNDEALEIALCYGWTDDRRYKLGNAYVLQKFAPRKEHASWSRQHITKANQLIKAGRMRPEGLSKIEAAKRAGRWKED